MSWARFDHWAKKWSTLKRNTNEIDLLVNKLRTWSLRTGQQQCPVEDKWLRRLVMQIDKLFFDNQLLAMCRQAFGRVLFKTPTVEDSFPGGLVEPHESYISFQIPKQLVSRLIFPPQQGFYVAGQLCQSPFECLIPVVLHETIHLFLLSWSVIRSVMKASSSQKDRHRNRNQSGPDPGTVIAHDGVFRTLARHWFGQTDYQHGLFNQLPKTQTFQQHRKSFKVGQSVEYNSPTHPDQWHKAKLIKLGYRHAQLKLQSPSSSSSFAERDASQTNHYQTHIGRIRHIQDKENGAV